MLVLHLSCFGHKLAGESLCTIHSLLRKHLSLNNARRTDLPYLICQNQKQEAYEPEDIELLFSSMAKVNAGA